MNCQAAESRLSMTGQTATGPGEAAAAANAHGKENSMQLSAPKQITWWIAVVVGVLGILATLVTIPVLSGFAFWLVVIGFLLLAVATLLEGL